MKLCIRSAYSCSTWTAPLSSYQGVACLKVITMSGEQLIAEAYSLVLKHPDSSQSLLLREGMLCLSETESEKTRIAALLQIPSLKEMEEQTNVYSDQDSVDDHICCDY